MDIDEKWRYRWTQNEKYKTVFSRSRPCLCPSCLPPLPLPLLLPPLRFYISPKISICLYISTSFTPLSVISPKSSSILISLNILNFIHLYIPQYSHSHLSSHIVSSHVSLGLLLPPSSTGTATTPLCGKFKHLSFSLRKVKKKEQKNDMRSSAVERGGCAPSPYLGQIPLC